MKNRYELREGIQAQRGSLIYAHSERGFALISQRTEKIQRTPPVDVS
jgi:hypothetical protein